jgi:hypothetical protein
MPWGLNFAVYLKTLVARARIELAIIAYQATVIPFNYPAKKLGGNGRTRTDDKHRMKVVH